MKKFYIFIETESSTHPLHRPVLFPLMILFRHRDLSFLLWLRRWCCSLGRRLTSRCVTNQNSIDSATSSHLKSLSNFKIILQSTSRSLAYNTHRWNRTRIVEHPVYHRYTRRSKKWWFCWRRSFVKQGHRKSLNGAGRGWFDLMLVSGGFRTSCLWLR